MCADVLLLGELRAQVGVDEQVETDTLIARWKGTQE